MLIMILPIMAIHACSESPTESLESQTEPTVEELEAKVIENCYILQEALENFWAGEYCEHYPSDIYAETNDAGLTVIDLLPGGELLENHFTGLRTEPVDTPAAGPGQICYYSFYNPGFYIFGGFGESGSLVVLTNLEDIEQRVMINCIVVQQAVEEWAFFSSGLYPDNVGVDTDPAGKTVTYYLPDRQLSENPVTIAATEPVDGQAYNWGETGYVPIVDGVVNTGYRITGVGVDIYGETFTICEIVKTSGTTTVTA